MSKEATILKMFEDIRMDGIDEGVKNSLRVTYFKLKQYIKGMSTRNQYMTVIESTSLSTVAVISNIKDLPIGIKMENTHSDTVGINRF